MLKDSYNIIIMSPGASQVLRFDISGALIKILLLISLIFIGSTFFVGYNYYSIISQKDHYNSLLKTLYLQKIQFKSLISDLDKMNELMKMEEDFDRKIRVVTYQQNGLAGMDLDQLNSIKLSNAFGEKSNGIEQEIEPKINQIRFDIALRKISYLQILSSIHENKDRLERTPTIRPVKVGYLTSLYGMRADPFTGSQRMHYGVDWAYYPFTPIYAPADGVVQKIVDSTSYGNFLTINHGYDMVTRYAHLAKVEVKVGQKIKRGQLIGRMGNTGLRSTATHLHYEMKIKGNFIDPSQYILEPLAPALN